MSPQYMYDGAYTPSLATAKAHGAIAMSHYLTRSYASTSAQPDAIRSAGMGVVLNWEGFASELKGASRSKGRACGEEALAALERGVPRDGAVKVFYSVDTDLTDLSVCDEAFRGINDAHAGTGIQVGVYGEGGLIERLHGLGLVQGGQWLSMSEGFGGFAHALRSGLVAVVQMHDAAGNWIGTDIPGTDRNTVLDPHALGAWWPDGSPYATTQGVFMALTDAQQRDLYNRVMGFDAQRWYIVQPDGTAKLVPAGTAGAIPAHALDTVDGNYLVRLIGGAVARIADLQAQVDQLKAQTGSPQITPVDIPVTGTVRIGGTA